jgi:predicted RNA-binding Zn-ribbon protein involved in translation (DUF1610 family)
MAQRIGFACDCGYRVDGVAVGKGVAGSPEDEAWAALCFSCETIVSTRINAHPLVCADCGLSDLELLGSIVPQTSVNMPASSNRRAKVTGREHVRCGDRVIDDSPFPCPRCGEITARGVVGGEGLSDCGTAPAGRSV